MNSTNFFLKNNEVKISGGLHCPKNALTNVFGWFLQILLACLAFTCLIGKLSRYYYCIFVDKLKF